MSILDFLWEKKTLSADPEQIETVQKIVKTLEGMPPEQARYIAGFAYILGRVAHADFKITEEETQMMTSIVRTIGRLLEDQAALVIEIVKEQNLLFGGTENYLVTRDFREIATRDQKMRLLHCLFAVSSTDRHVSIREDREIRQIASELRLGHRDFICVRSSYRKHLSVLK